MGIRNSLGCGIMSHAHNAMRPITARNKRRLEAKKLKRPSLCVGKVRITLSKDILP